MTGRGAVATAIPASAAAASTVPAIAAGGGQPEAGVAAPRNSTPGRVRAARPRGQSEKASIVSPP